MIICICRNIKDSDYDTCEELVRRVMEQDVCCGQCQEYCNKIKELLYEVE